VQVVEELVGPVRQTHRSLNTWRKKQRRLARTVRIRGHAALRHLKIGARGIEHDFSHGRVRRDQHHRLQVVRLVPAGLHATSSVQVACLVQLHLEHAATIHEHGEFAVGIRDRLAELRVVVDCDANARERLAVARPDRSGE